MWRTISSEYLGRSRPSYASRRIAVGQRRSDQSDQQIGHKHFRRLDSYFTNHPSTAMTPSSKFKRDGLSQEFDQKATSHYRGSNGSWSLARIEHSVLPLHAMMNVAWCIRRQVPYLGDFLRDLSYLPWISVTDISIGLIYKRSMPSVCWPTMS